MEVFVDEFDFCVVVVCCVDFCLWGVFWYYDCGVGFVFGCCECDVLCVIIGVCGYEFVDVVVGILLNFVVCIVCFE